MRLRSGRRALMLTALALVAAGASLAAEDDMRAGPPPEEMASAPAVAKKLWTELVCLCGRCERLTFSVCHCPEATAERKKILEMLRGRDLGSPAGAEAAHVAVLQAYVARFGRTVLATETPSGDWLAWLAMGVGVAAVVGALTLMRHARVSRPKARRKRRS